MKNAKLLCLVLALVLALSLIVSCNEDITPEDTSDVESNNESTVSETGSESSEEPSEEESREPLDHLDSLIAEYGDRLKDRTVVFLVENYNGGGYGSAEILPKEDTEVAPYVVERNNLVEQKLGIKIDEIRTDSMVTELRNAALTIPEFDIACPYLTTAAPLITENIFYDLYDFDNIINFEGDYWDHNAEESLSMGNKLYMTTGDFSLLTLDVTHCMLFNKNIVRDRNLENPYDLVESGNWTMDKMLEMAKKVTSDTDGESGVTYKDTIGLFINNNYSNSLFIGSGESFCKKNDAGVPELTIYSPKTTQVVDKIFSIFKDPAVLNIESFDSQARNDGFTNCYWASRDALANDRALFVTISLSDVLALNDYDDPQFGMLVTPKYEAEQERYYSYISIIFATGMVIPSGNEEPEIAALAMEAMNAASTDTVKLNYYERIFKLQKTKDDESEKMLDTIFDNRVYDIGALYNWGSIRDFVSSVVTSATNNFSSKYDSEDEFILGKMQETIDFFNDN